MTNYPESYKYTKQHEWVHVEGSEATVGITEHAQHELGDIVFVELPKVGAKTTKGQTFGSVESVKAVSDIYAPVSGEVIAINDLLSKTPEKLNEDPHSAAWLIKIRLSSPDETADLLNAADYQAYVDAES
ncbi:MAG: glycine cleavage system protein GcvH [Acidobacteriaceae bacterium]|nr:glycine cleavage system protein GcvH [Acidobacteriaceae bacterium]